MVGSIDTLGACVAFLPVLRAAFDATCSIAHCYRSVGENHLHGCLDHPRAQRLSQAGSIAYEGHRSSVSTPDSVSRTRMRSRPSAKILVTSRICPLKVPLLMRTLNRLVNAPIAV